MLWARAGLERWVTQKLFLSTSDIAFLDHESRIVELESDLVSCMRHEYCIHQHLSILEKGKGKHSPCSSDSDNPFQGVEHRQCITGERGMPYPCLSQHLQMAHHSSGPPCEENHEHWAGNSSE